MPTDNRVSLSTEPLPSAMVPRFVACLSSTLVLLLLWGFSTPLSISRMDLDGRSTESRLPATHRPDGPPTRVPPTTADTLRAVGRSVLRHTNRARAKRGRDTLAWDPELANVACAHTRDMFRRDFFRHKNPDGERPDERVARLHRRLIGGVGENLYGQKGVRTEGAALGAQMVEEWMNSPTHRKNILRPGVNHLGVCVLREQNTVRATQLFAKVYAYLTDPLPKTVTRSDVLSVSIEQTFPPEAAVVRYDFWDPRAKQKIGTTHVLNDSLFIPDTTGSFRTRFYLLEKGEYTARPGPQVTITPPPSRGTQE